VPAAAPLAGPASAAAAPLQRKQSHQRGVLVKVLVRMAGLGDSFEGLREIRGMEKG